MADGPVVTAIGAISGTSMDGIDVAVIRTDGAACVETGTGASYPYEDGLREELRQVIAEPEVAEHAALELLETQVTRAHAQAINRFMDEQGLDPAAVDVVGLHGQTVFHRPERRFTRQLGLGALTAELTGITTVNRFRHADVAAGGEGAPLVPLYHRALANGLAQPLMVLNLGGVANVTYLDGDTVIAFDTGPASAFDADGRLSGAGRIDRQILASLMNNPFFARPAPKSLDRQDFHERAGMVEILPDADGAATLAAFTVEATARALDHVPKRPLRWLVAGGGRLNLTFMRLFAERLGVPVEPVERVGWDGDFLEAQCFGYLAVRTLRGLPLSLPSTTGVPSPQTGGEIWPASIRRETAACAFP
jgi:anhydro-N-acetylmuramic acid kinase